MADLAVFYDKDTDVVVLKLKEGHSYPQIRMEGPGQADIRFLEQLARKHNMLEKVKVELSKMAKHNVLCSRHGDCVCGADEAKALLDELAKEKP